jgi:hypothetical protein
MKSPLVLKLAVATIVALPVGSLAADGAWKMPNLNPLADKGRAPTSSGAGNPPTSGWHMPNLWPKPAPPKRTAAQPSTWNKMTAGTQNFFSKTADALTPWDHNNHQDKAPPPGITGSNTAFTHNHAAKKSSSSSIAPASWWSSEKKSQPPKTVNEFLSQERPH